MEADALPEGHTDHISTLVVHATIVQVHSVIPQLVWEADPVLHVARNVGYLIIVLVAYAEWLAVERRPLLDSVPSLLDEIAPFPTLDSRDLAGVRAGDGHIARASAPHATALRIVDFGGQREAGALQRPLRLEASDCGDPVRHQ